MKINSAISLISDSVVIIDESLILRGGVVDRMNGSLCFNVAYFEVTHDPRISRRLRSRRRRHSVSQALRDSAVRYKGVAYVG